MRNKITNFLTIMAIATGTITASATSASVATVPQGLISYSVAAGTTNYLSLPLTATETYSSTVNTVTNTTISVSDVPAPFTTSLATPSAPFFVKFLSGAEAGRVMLITANTTTTLTLDTTDHGTGAVINLDTTGFAVASGDAFEIFPGDTVSSVFGDNSAQNPLVLTAGPTVSAADTVATFSTFNGRGVAYYFSTVNNCWMQYGVSGNANNAIIYPYAPMAITVRAGHATANIIATGRVTAVAAETKLEGGATVYTSTQYATDVTLSQLQFGSNWTTGATASVADTISVWNPIENQFDTYYQKPDLTWRKYSDSTTDQSNFSIPAGSVTMIEKRALVAGAQAFLQSTLPYSLE